jgi:protein required for attachment to host cells
LIDETAQLSDTETGTDEPTAFVSGGGVRHRGQPALDYHHRTAQRFARRIVQRLEQGRQQNEFGRLVLVAPPLMLGVLREELTAPLSKLVVEELSQELTRLTRNQILEHIAASLLATVQN